MIDAEIEELLKPILELYNQIEIELLLNVAVRFDTYETIGGSLDWYLKRLQGMGAFTKSNLKIIEKYSPASKKLIRKMLKQVGYDTMLTNGSMNLETLMASVVNRHIIESIISDLEADIKIINTKALENTNKAYMDILTKGYIETAGGVYSYQESIKKALVEMSKNGIAGATYLRKGKVAQYSLEGTVRRDILTRAHKCSVEVQMNNIKELGSNLVYVSQHMGARTHPTDQWANHAGWQGKVYMLEGSSDEYENLIDATGYGDITGLAGVNCRHHIYNYIEGVTYIPDRIDEEENERVYQLSQQQRKIERDVRKAKKELAVANVLNDPDLKRASKQKLKAKTDKLNEFVEAHKELKRDYSRTRVSEEYTK